VKELIASGGTDPALMYLSSGSAGSSGRLRAVPSRAPRDQHPAIPCASAQVRTVAGRAQRIAIGVKVLVLAESGRQISNLLQMSLARVVGINMDLAP
jgi:hypothetical protein